MGKMWWILVAVSAVAMAFMIVGVSSIAPATDTQPTEGLEFPCVLGDCGLVAEVLVNYEGVFREDGGSREVEGVAGLVVYNPGMEGVREAKLMVRQAQRTLNFAVTYLPADSRCLVLESAGQLYSCEPVTDCGYQSVTWGDLETKSICVQYEDSRLWIENKTDAVMDAVTIYYKPYISRERFYLGGITYSVTLEALQPWERREILSVIAGEIVAIE